MRRQLFAATLALFAMAGCVMEEELCTTNEECVAGWVCDLATGDCIPAEGYDADISGDGTLPDISEIEENEPPVDDDTTTDTTTDTDTTVDDDTTADTDTTADADTVVVDALPDVSDLSDESYPSDESFIPDEETSPDADMIVTDTVPDADIGACNDCTCAEFCNGHGICTEQYGYPECICDEPYDGSWCQQCAYGWQDHDGNGTCENDDCAHATAPVTGWLDCGPHGVCDDWGGAVPADCDCDTYWIDHSGGECNYCWASNPNDC
jgi:hypothetical protein